MVDFKYFQSCDIDKNISFKITSVSSLVVCAKIFDEFTSAHVDNYQHGKFEFSIKYKDIFANTRVEFDIESMKSTESTDKLTRHLEFYFFNKNGLLKNGKHQINYDDVCICIHLPRSKIPIVYWINSSSPILEVMFRKSKLNKSKTPTVSKIAKSQRLYSPAQVNFFNELHLIHVKICNSDRGKLNTILSESKIIMEPFNMASPIDPDIILGKLNLQNCILFKSAAAPILLDYETSKFIFKIDKDIVQEEKILNIVKWIENLLINNGMKIKLHHYTIASYTTLGIVEYVENAYTISKIIKTYGKIIDFISRYNSHNFGQTDAAIMNYTNSLAVWSVISYILGIGDRHLDNLMMIEDGNIFHIDFGFILGKDPKPFPTAMKISVELMLPCRKDLFFNRMAETYHFLRVYSEQFLDAIEDIQIQEFVKQRLNLKMSFEEADAHVINIAKECADSFYPRLVDKLHDLTNLI